MCKLSGVGDDPPSGSLWSDTSTPWLLPSAVLAFSGKQLARLSPLGKLGDMARADHEVGGPPFGLGATAGLRADLQGRLPDWRAR